MLNQISALFIAFLIVSQPIFSENKETSMTQDWFKEKNCTALEIKKYAALADSKIIAAVKVEDSEVVKKIMTRIERIPLEGDEMISFGREAEFIELFFSCGAAPTQSIKIISKMFKTPSGGFNSEKNAIEAGIYTDIEALLFPDMNKKILKVRNLEINFGDFSVTYGGETNWGGEPGAPTVSGTDHKYAIKDKNGKVQDITITFGQVPVGPRQFEVNKRKLLLLTNRTAKDIDLAPDYFQIAK
jgi:hypothetical protein